jgi:hypothetical protein
LEQSRLAQLEQLGDRCPVARGASYPGRRRSARPGEYAAQFAAGIPIWGVQVDRAAEHPGLVPAAVRPNLLLRVGYPCGHNGSGYIGQEYRAQQPWIRLIWIRIVAHAAGEFLAGEYRRACLHTDASGYGVLQFGGQ